MDGLIVLLIIIGVVTSISKSNKKKKAAAAQKRAEEPSSAQPKAGTTKIPYTREEWEAFLADAEGEAAAKPAPAKKAAAKPAAPKPAPQKRRAQAVQQSVAAPAPAAMSTGSIALDPKQSVEGETETEHAAHRLRAEREEQRIHVERAAEQALAEVNLQALRSAVVMKEILDKPVSLRPRRRYY